MKRIISFLLCAFAVVTLYADPQESRSIDFASRTAPSLQVYQANVKTYAWTVYSGGTILNLTGYTPYMFITSNEYANAIVTAACTVVSATGGTFNAYFSASSLNTNGIWIYGVGVTSNGATTAREGDFILLPDPYATGAGNMAFTTNFPFSLLTGTPTTGSGYGITDLASLSAFNSHTSNLANPHATTAAQVGAVSTNTASLTNSTLKDTPVGGTNAWTVTFGGNTYIILFP